MEREIKFRVWDTESESMENEIAIGKGYGKDSYILFLGLGETFIIEDKLKVMQYTGLKDKNGVEIYEGDYMLDGHSGRYGEVKFTKGAFVIEFENEIQDLYDWTCEYVIGNIYENKKKLIKEEYANN